MSEAIQKNPSTCYGADTSFLKATTGYKRTDAGVIPENWTVKSLGDIFTLKHGFAFKSEYFSLTGPIVLTPGNFRLDGGLYFEHRNTKHYSGPYSLDMTFSNGDLLIVMTDLTPDCNLLGRPAFVESDEIVLHNQRIGKVVLKDKFTYPLFLFYVLLSRPYLNRIREGATGSTVRHTSNKSIYDIQIAWPELAEQRGIAEALSDVDELLGALEALIEKKGAIRQATMQQLLTGKTRLPEFNGRWETKPLDQLANITMGQSPSSQFYNSRGDGLPLIQGNADIKNRRTIERVWTTQVSKRCGAGALLLTVRAPVGTVGIASKAACLGRGVCSLEALVDTQFLFHALVFAEARWRSLEQGSTFTSANSRQVGQFALQIPDDPREQKAVASILSDMDAEIAALEARRDKTRALKQGMMQQLLTGRIRLVKPQRAEAEA